MPSNVFWGFQHLNANVIASVQIDMSGPDALNHEMLEICVMPLDAKLDIHPELLLFNMRMKPEDPDSIDHDFCRFNKIELGKIMINAFPRHKVADLLEKWFHHLALNRGKQIIPLSYDWPWTRERLIHWLGYETFSHIFSEDYRDIHVAANYVNDTYDVRAEPVPFAKQTLRWIGKKLHVETMEHGGSCVEDCRQMAEIYKRLLMTP